MNVYPAVDAFVPLYIFVPLILVGVVGLIATPNPKRGHQDAAAHDRSPPDTPPQQTQGRPSLAR